MKIYSLEIELLEPMLGTVAKDPDVYSRFIESKKPQEIIENESEAVPYNEEKGWTGFAEDESGLFVWDYFLKGFLKYAANVMKEDIGIKALKKKVTDFVFVFPRRIYLGVSHPDDILERPLRGQTAQGPRVSLAKSDLVNAGRKFTCEIRVLRESLVSEKTLRAILDYGQYQGLGQWRNGSYGRFTYTLTVK